MVESPRRLRKFDRAKKSITSPVSAIQMPSAFRILPASYGGDFQSFGSAAGPLRPDQKVKRVRRAEFANASEAAPRTRRDRLVRPCPTERTFRPGYRPDHADVAGYFIAVRAEPQLCFMKVPVTAASFETVTSNPCVVALLHETNGLSALSGPVGRCLRRSARHVWPFAAFPNHVAFPHACFRADGWAPRRGSTGRFAGRDGSRPCHLLIQAACAVSAQGTGMQVRGADVRGSDFLRSIPYRFAQTVRESGYPAIAAGAVLAI
jgi:hypothetical protein